MAKGGTNNGKGWDKQWPQVGITVAKGGTNSSQRWDRGFKRSQAPQSSRYIRIILLLRLRPFKKFLAAKTQLNKS